jgi:hypothetical protein
MLELHLTTFSIMSTLTPQKIQKRIGSHKYQGYTKQKWHKWKRSEEGWQEAVAVPASINLR